MIAKLQMPFPNTVTAEEVQPNEKQRWWSERQKSSTMQTLLHNKMQASTQFLELFLLNLCESRGKGEKYIYWW